jgi:tRNA pseudouridine55 synthase
VTRRRACGRPVDGVLLLDKPRGISSQTAVSRVKALLGAAKAGHTGTLDPLADGLLPVCLGEATKFAQGLLDADKGYRAVVLLGLRTATGDLEGEMLAQCEPAVSREAAISALERLRGDIMQVPPMYSALKRDGKPLYEYARAGQELPREPRAVHISRLELEAMALPDLTISVTCSKGTYIRVLAEDLGNALGCGACLASLTRTAVGTLGLEQAVALGALEDAPPDARMARLLPVDTLVLALPRVDLPESEAAGVRAGRPALAAGLADGALGRAYGPDGRFMGLVAGDGGGRIVPRRLISSEAMPAAAGRLAENGGNA